MGILGAFLYLTLVAIYASIDMFSMPRPRLKGMEKHAFPNETPLVDAAVDALVLQFCLVNILIVAILAVSIVPVVRAGVA